MNFRSIFSRLKDTNIVSSVSVVLCLLLLAYAIPATRSPLLFVLKFPLKLLSLTGREINGLVFYHRNFMQNEKLKRENDLLKRQLYDASEVALENKRLNELLSFKQSAGYKVIAARVIGRDPSNWASVIIINRGSSSGIRKGFICVSFLGLAGRVVETTRSTSKIVLINDPNIGVSAIVQRSRQEGLVCGSLGGLLVMKYLPRDADIQPLDTVMTSGLTSNYPKGILIGTVVSVGDEFSGLSRYAVIKPAVSLAALEEALVIIP